MPRRRHRGGGHGTGEASLHEESDGGRCDRGERLVVFQRTKMCKFHILGVCTKGSGCRFAHHRSELQALPDLQRTKLCKTLISTGECSDPACRYAHTKEELRPVPEPGQEGYCGEPQDTGPAFRPAPTHLAQRGATTPVAPGCVPPSQKTALQQAVFDSAMHAAILQMGQAAQAHAVEAARLQQLAAQLHQAGAGAALPGGLPFYAMAPFPCPAPEQGVLLTDAVAASESHTFLHHYGQTAMGHHGAEMAAAFLAAGAQAHHAGGGPARPPDRHGLGGGAGGSGFATGAQAAGASASRPPVDWALTMSRVLGDEPVQIQLRSLSSNSLVLMAEEAERREEAERTANAAAAAAGEPASPKEARQRRGRLGMLAEESHCRMFERRSQEAPVGAQQAGSHAASGDVLCSSGEPPPCAAEAEAEAAWPGLSSGSTGGSAHGGAAGEAEGPAPVFGDFLGASVTVKNTFLDFKPKEPSAAMRMVKSAAGLDMMGRE